MFHFPNKYAALCFLPSCSYISPFEWGGRDIAAVARGKPKGKVRHFTPLESLWYCMVLAMKQVSHDILTNSMGGSARKYEKLMKNGHWNFRKIIAWKILREPWMSINCSSCISEMHSLSWNRCLSRILFVLLIYYYGLWEKALEVQHVQYSVLCIGLK